MLLANVAIAHGYDDFYTVVPSDEGPVSWLGLIKRPFMPLTWSAWIGYAATICWVLMVYLWVEILPRWKASDVPANLSGRNDFNGRWSLLHTAKRIAISFYIQLQLAAHGLSILGDQLFQPVTYGGKIVSISVQLFIVTMVASYTANLAAVLSSGAKHRFESLDDAIAAKVPICIPDVLTDLGQQLGLGNLAVPTSTDKIFRTIDEGGCVVGVMPRVQFDAVRAKYGCNERIAGRAVAYMRNHMMARDELVQPVGRAIERLLAQNLYARLEAQWLAAWPAISGLPTCDGETDSSDSSSALDLVDLGGLYILVILATLVALALELFLRSFKTGAQTGLPPFELAVSSVNSYSVQIRDEPHVQMPLGMTCEKLDDNSTPSEAECTVKQLELSVSESVRIHTEE